MVSLFSAPGGAENNVAFVFERIFLSTFNKFLHKWRKGAENSEGKAENNETVIFSRIFL